MKKVNGEDIVIINTILDSMRALLGNYADSLAIGIEGLSMGDGKILKSESDLGLVIKTLVSKYESVIGNSAVVNIAESLIPYIKTKKGLRTSLPKSILDAMSQRINVSESLKKWNKNTNIDKN